MTAQVIDIASRRERRRANPLSKSREDSGGQALDQLEKMQTEGKKLSRNESAKIAKGCNEIYVGSRPKPRALRRASEHLGNHFDPRFTSKLLLRPNDPPAKQEGKGLHRTPMHYAWFIRAMAVATDYSLGELADRALRHATFHPANQQPQEELDEAIDELEQICREMDERFALREAYQAISDDNLRQFQLGNREALWPAETCCFEEDEFSNAFEREQSARARLQAAQTWSNLWLGFEWTFDDREMRLFPSDGAILSMPRAYLGELIDVCLFRKTLESDLPPTVRIVGTLALLESEPKAGGEERFHEVPRGAQRSCPEEAPATTQSHDQVAGRGGRHLGRDAVRLAQAGAAGWPPAA